MENPEIAKAREKILDAAAGFGDLDHAIDCFVSAMDEARQRQIGYLREQIGKVIRNIELDRHEVATLACRVIDDNLKKL